MMTPNKAKAIDDRNKLIRFMRDSLLNRDWKQVVGIILESLR